MNKKWNIEEEKSDLGIWIESIFGAAVLVTMGWVILIGSAAFY